MPRSVSRLVALADLGGRARARSASPLGELLEERLRLTSPWYRGVRVRRRRARLADRVRARCRARPADRAGRRLDRSSARPAAARARGRAGRRRAQRAHPGRAARRRSTPSPTPTMRARSCSRSTGSRPGTTTVVVGMPGAAPRVADATPPVASGARPRRPPEGAAPMSHVTSDPRRRRCRWSRPGSPPSCSSRSRSSGSTSRRSATRRTGWTASRPPSSTRTRRSPRRTPTARPTVLAGRQLVTELTGDDSPGMDWTLSNAADAEEGARRRRRSTRS